MPHQRAVRLAVIALLASLGGWACHSTTLAGPEADVVALHAQAHRLLEKGESDDAAEHLRQAAILAEEGNRPALAAVLLLDLGNLLGEMGRAQASVIAYEQGLRLLARDDRFHLADLLEDLRRQEKGVSRGSLIVPEDLYTPQREADLLRAADDDSALHLRLLLGIANAYLGQAQDAVALVHLERALALPAITGQPLIEARARANSAAALRRLGRLDEARASLRRAVALFTEHGESTAVRRAYSTLGSLALQTGDLEGAVAHYTRALELHAAADDLDGQARALTGLGRTHLEAGRHRLAIEFLERARNTAREAHAHESRLFSLLGLGVAYRQAGDTEAAAAALEEALPLVERRRGELRTDEGKIAYLDSIASVHEELLRLHLERAENDAVAWAAALRVSEKARGRALDDLVGSRRRDGADFLPVQSVLGTGSTNPAAQTAVGTPSAAPADTAGPDPSQVAGGTALAPPPDLFAVREPPAVREPSPLARLSFHVLDDRTAVFAVDPQGRVTGHVAPVGRDDLRRRLGQLRAALGIDASLRGLRDLGSPAGPSPRPGGGGGGGGGDPTPILADLYSSLIAPLEGSLPPPGTTLALLPHGPLWLTPLSALLDASGRSLGEKWPLIHATSWSLLQEIRREVPKAPGELSFLLVGNPSVPDTAGGDGLRFEPLPGAEAEARTLAGLAPATAHLFTGDDATASAVLPLLGESDVVHLATHGLADDADPLSSYLLLAGGDRLTARQVIRDLGVPAQLVVLSACQTGLGQVTGDGTLGLSRSFLAAGARSVVVSLWSVDDAATARLMESFYRAHLAGASKAEALHRAMGELRADPAHRSPAHWAPFLLVGAED